MEHRDISAVIRWAHHMTSGTRGSFENFLFKCKRASFIPSVCMCVYVQTLCVCVHMHSPCMWACMHTDAVHVCTRPDTVHVCAQMLHTCASMCAGRVCVDAVCTDVRVCTCILHTCTSVGTLHVCVYNACAGTLCMCAHLCTDTLIFTVVSDTR